MAEPKKVSITIGGEDKVTFERHSDLQAGDSYDVLVNGKPAGVIDNETTLAVNGKGGRDAVIALHPGMSDPDDVTPRIEMNTDEPAVVVGGPFIVAKGSKQAAAIPVTPDAEKNKTVTQKDGTQITYKDLEDSERAVTVEDGAKKGVEFFDPKAKDKSLSRVGGKAAGEEKSGDQEEEQDKENDGKGLAKGIGIGALLMGLLGALKGGMGGLMTLIMGLVAGIFMSRAFSGNDQQQQQGQGRERGGQERSRTPVKDLTEKLTALGKNDNFPAKDFDLDKDGKVSMNEKLDRDKDGKVSIKEAEDAIGFKIDKDGDNKVSDKEMRALNHRLGDVIKKHPELKDISDSLKKEMGKIAAGTTTKDTEQQRGSAAQESGQSR